MNSNYGKSNTSSGSLNSFNFDLGLNSGRPRSLNDQKNNTSSSYTYTSTQQPKPSTGSSWTGQPNRPAWTHQPAAASVQSGLAGALSGPTSMVGDILGKSWSSSGPATGGDIGIGIVKKDPNLFGDLVTSALGQNKGGSGNVPLKNAGPTGNKSAFSMGGMADSLPKTGNTVKSGGSWGSTQSFGSFTSTYNVNNNSTSNVNLGGNSTKGPNLGGPSMKGMTGSGVGIGMNSNKDPFGNLVDFSAKPSGSMNSGSKTSNKSSSVDDSFGEFQNSTKTSGSSFTSNAFPTGNNSSSMGSTTGGSYSKVDDFGVFNTPTQPPSQSSGVNDFDALFTSSTASSGGALKGSDGLVSQQFSGGDDWGMGPEFGGGDDTSGMTELEGLPPPPAGFSASAAKNKGMDNYKSGQYADAIKWLSWAVVLLEKAGDDAGTTEVLSSRASCYKEVGEYKKAVADCSKVLEHDGNNVSVLVQRALLYESMEKYKLGAEDLRTVMKLDPGNRVARSTIHRLTQMAG